MSGFESVEREDFDDGEAGIEWLRASGFQFPGVPFPHRSSRLHYFHSKGFTAMLFMVVERFKDRRLTAERFRRNGRMLPEDVTYDASWMVLDGGRCFQVMEAPDQETLMTWVRRWDDIVDFEVVPVLTSQQYWASKEQSA